MNKVALNLKEKATKQERNLNLRNECMPLTASPPSCAPSRPCRVIRKGLLYLVLVYPDAHSCATIKVGCRISDLIALDTCITGFKDIKRKRNSSPHCRTRLWMPLIPLTSVASISSLDVVVSHSSIEKCYSVALDVPYVSHSTHHLPAVTFMIGQFGWLLDLINVDDSTDYPWDDWRYVEGGRRGCLLGGTLPRPMLSSSE